MHFRCLTIAIWLHQLRKVMDSIFVLCCRMYSSRHPRGISCVIIMGRSVRHRAMMRIQHGCRTDAITRASASNSLVLHVAAPSCSSFMATGIFTCSPSGTHSPWKNKTSRITDSSCILGIWLWYGPNQEMILNELECGHPSMFGEVPFPCAYMFMSQILALCEAPFVRFRMGKVEM